MSLSTITGKLLFQNLWMASWLFWDEFCKASNSSLEKYWSLLFLYALKEKKVLHTFLFALLKSTSSLGKTTRLENFYKRNQNGVSYHHNSVFLEVAFTFKLLIEGYFSAIYKMWLESIVSILSGSYYRLSNFFCWKCSQSSEPYNYAVRIESKSREQSQQTYLCL